VVQCIPSSPNGSPPATAVCGDGFRASTEACDDGNTVANDGCSPSCEITPQLVSPRVEVLGKVVRINSAGDAVGSFGGERFNIGGGTYSTSHAIDTNGVTNAAPEELYQTERSGDFSYTLSGLSPGVAYTLRLHFAEIHFDGVGQRVFNVAINGTKVLANFDIFALAGANKALVREFSPAANGAGQIVVSFVSLVDEAELTGLELIPPPSQVSPAAEVITQLNAGGAEVGSFGDDQSFNDGGAYSSSAIVSTSGVANAAPAEVYQSERVGDFSYTLGGLTPAETYTVRLHFAEIWWTSEGDRRFNTAINGTQVLTEFDVVSAAGGANIAVVRDFSAVANAQGQIEVTFTSVVDLAKLSGLEVLKPIAQAHPSLPGRTIGAGRHPLAAGCNAVALAFAEDTQQSAALYLSTFKAAGQPFSSVQVAQTKVSAPEPGVAALPGDDFVVAWTDFDEDELGISLRKVVGGVAQGKAVIANEDPAFSQSGSDIVFDGNELVVAWVDSHDATNGPDLRYRLFTPDLKPLTGDQVLSATGAVEDNVVLAGRNGHWAAAWRAGSQGMESIEVQSGSSHWTVGPFAPGAADDRPDLIFLDDSHLAVAFTKGTDTENTGQANVPRLHAAVLDPRTPGATESFALAPAQMPYAIQSAVGQTQPNLVLSSDHLLVAWRSDAVFGEHLGSELWSRRVPFTVSGNTLTLDPSHLETPLIQTDAQREGDQDAFRMVATTLWPSGGIASVWDDSSRSFGAKSGGPDVVLQVARDVPERVPPLTSYAVSDNGLYYDVNLLRRNYPGPTVTRTYQGDATYFIPQMVPESVFDGDDNWWAYSSASGADPNAGATLTIDMGQYFSVGAVRLLYYYTGNAPPTQTLRLGTTPTDAGNWQTILDNTPGLDDHTYSFNVITARFLEVKMKGAPKGGLMEVMVYPSTQTGPAPSPIDGYDLSYFATVTANSNCNKPTPWLWTGGVIAANVAHQGTFPYATGDCVGTYDLGAQYPVSRVYLNFYVGSNWASGGRVDVAATPGAYSNVYDSGVGNQFAFTDSMGYTFPSQPVQYIRMTDYAIPGVGPASGILQSIQAFATPSSRVAYYPLGADRNYFSVNLARRPAGDIQPTAAVVYSNGALAYASPPAQNAANVLDGDDVSFNWTATSGTLAAATTTLTVDLGQVQSVGAIRQLYGNYWPLSTSLRVAQSLAGPWTQAMADTAVTSNDFTSSFAGVPVRYVELTMKGTTSVAFVNLLELQVFPSSTTEPAPSSAGHLDRAYLSGMSVTQNANMGRSGAPRVHSVQGATGYYVKNTAQGATGDATLTIDLGQQYSISEVGLSFFGNQTWPAGGKIDVDDGAGGWATVFDTGHGTALGPAADGTERFPFAPHLTRHVRLTGYFDPALGQGLLENIEVF